MYNAWHQYKIMEQLQIGNMSLNTSIDFIRQQELIQKYKHLLPLVVEKRRKLIEQDLEHVLPESSK